LWHENKNDAYVKFAHGSDTKVPGFGKRFDADRNATDFLKYDEFCLLLHKWHKAIFTALKTCIDSGNWMQMRNSINVLKALYPSFPKVENMAHDLRQIITQLGEAEKRLDLKRSLQSILADFTKGEKFLVKEWTFKNVSVQKAILDYYLRLQAKKDKLSAPPITTNGAEKAATENANTPQPQETKLDATAAAFQPKTEM
jgi:THO complex subunit 2